MISFLHWRYLDGEPLVNNSVPGNRCGDQSDSREEMGERRERREAMDWRALPGLEGDFSGDIPITSSHGGADSAVFHNWSAQ